MRKAIFLVTLVFVFSGLLLLVGCGTAPEAERPAPPETPGAAEVPPAGEVVELKLHHQDPSTDAIGKGLEDWAREVAAKTDGKIKITVYPSATLGPGPKGLELTKDGVADIAWVSVGLYPGRFPLTEITTLPLMGMKTGAQSSKVAWELYTKSEAVQKEWEDPDIRVLTVYSSGETPMGVPREIKTVADFKGLKIRTIGGGPTELLKRAGAVPVVMPPTEVYQQVERKVLDGWAIDWHAAVGFKFLELSPYVLTMSNNYYSSTHGIVMNNKSYEKIPAEYRETFDSLCGDYFAQLMGEHFDAFIEPGEQMVRDSGGQLITLLPEVEAELQGIADAIADEHVKKADEQGLPGTETLQLVKQLVQQYSE